IRDTAYGRQLNRRPTLDKASRDALEELSDGVFLDRIPREEREILIDAIMPPAPETEQERSRLAQYALLLWRTRAKGEQPEESDIFDAARNVPHGLPKALVPVLNDWLEYVIPEAAYLFLTHHAVWHAPDGRLVNVTPYPDPKHHPLPGPGSDILFLVDDS